MTDAQRAASNHIDREALRGIGASLGDAARRMRRGTMPKNRAADASVASCLERLAPQMAAYERFGGAPAWRPYVMFSQTGNYRSDVVNTDRHGMRISVDQRGPFGIDDVGHERCNVLVGNSLAFGVGASSDATTISSLLSRHGERWVNLAGRGYSGWQELIAFLAYRDRLPGLRRVVVLSGLADFPLAFAPRLFDETFGPFFFSDRFYKSFATEVPGWRERVRPWLHSLLRRRRRRPVADIQSVEADVQDRWPRREAFLVPIRKTLSAWADLQRGAGFDLLYALQPAALLIDRLPPPEEEQTTSYYDSLGSPWLTLMRVVLSSERYQWYRSALQGICLENGVRFVDLNELFPDTGWHFIDRLHLTDEGQRVASELIAASWRGRDGSSSQPWN